MSDRIKEAFDRVRAKEELKDKTRASLMKKTKAYTAGRPVCYGLAVSAAACFLVLFIGGPWFYFTPTAQISIDINPSIELGINRLDRVVAVDAYNEDGRELAKSLDIRYLGYQEAVSRILENDKVADLLSENEVLTITVIEPKNAQSLRILSDMENCAAGHKNTYCYSADLSEVSNAHEHGMSCGKYRAYLELQRLCPDITPEKIQGMTMREIRDLAGELSGDEGQDTEEGESMRPGRGRHGGRGHHGASH